MDILFAYRGTRDLKLELLKDLYLTGEEKSYVHGGGMYLTQTYKNAQNYTLGFKKWSVVCKYKVMADAVVCIENYNIVEGEYENAELSQLMQLESRLHAESEDLRKIMKLKTVQDFPGYWTMPPSEQNQVMDEVLAHNNQIIEQFKDHPDIKQADLLFEQYRRLQSLVQEYFKNFCPVLLFLDQDMLVVKNEEAKIEALSFDLYADEETLEKVNSVVLEGEKKDGCIKNIPIEYTSLIDQILSSLD